jgi:hypothetical protein
MMFGGKVKVDKLGKEFYKASEKNDVEKMKQIIESGLDPNAPCNELGWFPLHCAVRNLILWERRECHQLVQIINHFFESSTGIQRAARGGEDALGQGLPG